MSNIHRQRRPNKLESTTFASLLASGTLALGLTASSAQAATPLHLTLPLLAALGLTGWGLRRARRAAAATAPITITNNKKP